MSASITVEITKGAREDRVTVTRAAGAAMSFQFPKKGPLPHDAVHYVVESVMGLQQAFWGRMAAGQSPDSIQQLAHAGGHPSAKRAGKPAADIVWPCCGVDGRRGREFACRLGSRYGCGRGCQSEEGFLGARFGAAQCL